MLNWTRKLFEKKPEADVASKLYDCIVAQARNPYFYRDWAVADSLDGRFDMIAIHMFLVLQRLRDELSTKPATQELANLVVTDLDSSIRELGASDMSVGKKVQKMARALYGRIEAYQAAYDADDADMLAEAVMRNVYRTESGEEENSARIAAYMKEQSKALELRPVEEFQTGRVIFDDEGIFKRVAV